MSVQIKNNPLLFWPALGSMWAWILAGNPCAAQIVPDATLPVNSVVTPQGTTFVIEGGSQAGGNLFHSFQEFSVPTGSEAFFNNGADIQNIFSRVTGSSISNLDGLIKANGTANLFLINPNGIIFGPNSRLNIGGSFVGSTASSVNFADGTQFSAKNPQTTPLLTISVPIGLQLGETAGGIVSQADERSYYSSDFTVNEDKTLALVGSGVTLGGSDLSGGRIELGSVGNSSLVRLNPTEQGWALNYEGVQNFQDIQLLSNSRVFGDNIQVRGRQVRFTNSSITAQTNLAVTASELVEVSRAGLVSEFEERITTGKLIVRDEGDVESQGNLTVNASEFVEVFGTEGESGVSSQLATYSVVDADTVDTDGGNLTIETGRLVARDGGRIVTTTYGAGQAGNLIIRAEDSVEVSGGGGIFAVTAPGSTGAGGNLTIETGRLLGTNVAVRSFGQGSRGTLTLNTTEPLPAVEVQIIPDGTLPISSTVRAAYLDTSMIEGGTQVGSNLFHSFVQFSVPTKSTAHFNNALDIQNIISRVTGRSPSNIDGFLEANGTANLFLINPNGIIFGRNAILNIGGSFVASTASSLNFADGVQFSAVTPQATPTLTMSVPTGLQFGNNPGSILNQATFNDAIGVAFSVPPGRSLALVGGEVRLDGVRLEASRVELGAVSGAGTVGLNFDDNNLSLSFPAGIPLADIFLINASIFPGDYGLHVQGRRVTFENSSILMDYIDISTDSLLRGDLTIAASELVELRDSSLYNSIGGNIRIDTARLVTQALLGRFPQISTNNLRERGTGDLTINASESVEINGGSLSTEVYNASGTSGSLTIQTRNLIVRDGGKITTGTFGAGQGGNLIVNASNSVELSGKNSVLDSVTTTPPSDLEIVVYDESGSIIDIDIDRVGGNIDIQTGQLIVRDGARVNVSSYGKGDAGSLTVKAGSIFLDSGSIEANTVGGQGNIELRTPALILRRGSSITTNASGNNNIGGNIILNADALAPLENSSITANAQNSRGGRVIINTSGVFRSAESQITATGAGGNPELSGTVEINTPDVDPSQGLVELSTEVVDASNQIIQTCSTGKENQFAVTGRGGLPPSPTDALGGNSVWVDLRGAGSRSEVLGNRKDSLPAIRRLVPTTQIVEATGWIIAPDGKVILTANAPNVTPHSPTLTSPTCQASQ